MLVLWVLHLCAPELSLGSPWDEWPTYSLSLVFQKLYLEAKQL